MENSEKPANELDEKKACVCVSKGSPSLVSTSFEDTLQCFDHRSGTDVISSAEETFVSLSNCSHYDQDNRLRFDIQGMLDLASMHVESTKTFRGTKSI